MASLAELLSFETGYDQLQQEFRLLDPTATSLANEAPALADDTVDDLVTTFARVPEHLNLIEAMMDELRAIQWAIDDQKERVKDDNKDLWDNNQNMRMRGLVSGTARKQRRLKGNYVPVDQLDPQALQHRKQVEEQDALDRNRLAGLRSMSPILRNAYMTLKGVQLQCEYLIQAAEKVEKGEASEREVKDLENIEEAVFGETLIMVAGVSELLTVIHAEYDNTL